MRIQLLLAGAVATLSYAAPTIKARQEEEPPKRSGFGNGLPPFVADVLEAFVIKSGTPDHVIQAENERKMGQGSDDLQPVAILPRQEEGRRMFSNSWITEHAIVEAKKEAWIRWLLEEKMAQGTDDLQPVSVLERRQNYVPPAYTNVQKEIYYGINAAWDRYELDRKLQQGNDDLQPVAIRERSAEAEGHELFDLVLDSAAYEWSVAHGDAGADKGGRAVIEKCVREADKDKVAVREKKQEGDGGQKDGRVKVVVEGLPQSCCAMLEEWKGLEGHALDFDVVGQGFVELTL
ncbi:hypothetical protein CTA2_6220 [Colletotrichum tanaceti]|uniref:Uncharacterized protein n=1 Tax=Colletotrichum tanaceti TaxID=1306861 RepID=A0A4U6X5A2_9PEZI|nr:hypothetical protein CTA2_6220 [Colletotrichum tanaceti]TKW50395.1 hypothetical protein CTA1_1178 [Colletotrichum tanaceti]